MEWYEFFKFPLSIDENGGWVVAQPGDMGYRWAWDWIKNDFICVSERIEFINKNNLEIDYN